MQYYYTQSITSHGNSTHDRHENDNLSTAHQFSCWVHRLKRSRTSPHSPCLQQETLTTASGADNAVDASHRQEQSTSSSYWCCCGPESLILPYKLKESRHDALDSPSTPCIRVPSPLAWGRNNVRELRAQRRHVLEDGGRGSILTASPFSYSRTIGAPAVNQSVSSTNCCCTNTSYLVRGGKCSLRIIPKK